MNSQLQPIVEPSRLSAMFSMAAALHGSGRVAEAEAAYLQVVAAHPAHAEALHGLGCLAFQAGKLEKAAELIAQAIQSDPARPIYFSNLGGVLRRLGRLDEALAACLQALRLDPAFSDGFGNLANVLGDQGKHEAAAEVLRRLIGPGVRRVDVRLQLARALILAGKADAAIEELLDLLGITPLFAPAYTNLGVAFKKLGRRDEAISAYETALGIAPGDPAALNNLGIVLQEIDRYDAAVGCFRQAIAAQANFAGAHLNLSLVDRDEMRIDAAIEGARAAIRCEPALAEAHTALGFNLLIAGQLEEGFAEYEWRTRMADFPSPKRSFPSPVWDGSDLSGRTVVVHDEQGVGDAIQFVRYAPLLQALGARVFVECNVQLTRLLTGMEGVDGVIGRGNPLPLHDFHVSMLSLPYLLGTRLDTIPAQTPYLQPEPALIAHWADRLGPRRGLRVGMIWAGNPEFKADRVRSPRLRAFLPLLQVAGCEVFGLQKGAGYQDLQACAPLPHSFTDLGPGINDFADTAAIMSQMDLVISSCTGPAHLAGALGCPTWTVLPFAPDWRWLERGLDTPWYPSMRLFRQDQRGDWGPVVERVRDALAQASQAVANDAGETGSITRMLALTKG